MNCEFGVLKCESFREFKAFESMVGERNMVMVADNVTVAKLLGGVLAFEIRFDYKWNIVI